MTQKHRADHGAETLSVARSILTEQMRLVSDRATYQLTRLQHEQERRRFHARRVERTEDQR